jgi:hypothetical protein
VLYYCTVHNQSVDTGLDIEVSQLHEENAQVAVELDRLPEEKTNWLQT